MMDPKVAEIIANMPLRATAREPVTREELERLAKKAAEEDEDTVEQKQEYEDAERAYEEAKQAFEEAKQAYEDALSKVYERNLEELLDEHKDDLSG